MKPKHGSDAPSTGPVGDKIGHRGQTRYATQSQKSTRLHLMERVFEAGTEGVICKYSISVLEYRSSARSFSRAVRTQLSV